MSFLDKVKGFATGHKKEIKTGLEKVEAIARDKAPEKYDAKISKAVDKVGGLVDKLPDGRQSGPAVDDRPAQQP
jgi:hypothetical protein